MNRTPEAIAANDSNRWAIEVLLNDIQAGLKAFYRDSDGSWGDAGSLAHYRENLQDVADSLNHRGEYA